MSALSGVLPEYGLSEYDLTPSTGAPGVVALFLCGVFPGFAKKKKTIMKQVPVLRLLGKYTDFFFF